MIRTSIESAEHQLRDLIKAALKGEDVYIEIEDDTGDQVVQLLVLVHDEHRPPRRTPGSAKGMIWMSEDFDAPLDEFDEYQ